MQLLWPRVGDEVHDAQVFPRKVPRVPRHPPTYAMCTNHHITLSLPCELCVYTPMRMWFVRRRLCSHLIVGFAFWMTGETLLRGQGTHAPLVEVHS